MISSSPLLKVQDATWAYRTPSGWVQPAAPVSFEVRAGEIVLLSGDNGSGKTTILRGMLGLVSQRAGSTVWGLPRSETGYVPQESVLDRSVPATALDVVRIGSPTRWGSGRAEAMAALAKVWLQDMRHVRFGSLSGGQRQRVLVARALVGGPRLLILDEPTVNVDAGTADQIGQLLGDLQRSGLGMVITSHVRDWVTASREVMVRAQPEEVSHG